MPSGPEHALPERDASPRRDRRGLLRSSHTEQAHYRSCTSRADSFTWAPSKPSVKNVAPVPGRAQPTLNTDMRPYTKVFVLTQGRIVGLLFLATSTTPRGFSGAEVIVGIPPLSKLWLDVVQYKCDSMKAELRLCC